MNQNQISTTMTRVDRDLYNKYKVLYYQVHGSFPVMMDMINEVLEDGIKEMEEELTRRRGDAESRRERDE